MSATALACAEGTHQGRLVLEWTVRHEDDGTVTIKVFKAHLAMVMTRPGFGMPSKGLSTRRTLR